MVSASVIIYQNDVNGTLMFSNIFFIKDDDYSKFRNEFDKAIFTGITDIGNEKWITTDNITLFFKR